MKNKLLNYQLIESIGVSHLSMVMDGKPFPWINFQYFLTEEGFWTLYNDFPSMCLFEKHQDIPRNYGQRPHNRYYLAYEHSSYCQLKSPGKGIVKHEELPLSWQFFIQELNSSKEYKKLLSIFLDTQNFTTRYVWHIGISASEVSPHVDAVEKIGTHIFYFNSSQDWKSSWGGATLILSDKLISNMNPDFEDFASIEEINTLDNHSLLTKRTSNAWHGVKSLTCPRGKYRKIFKVVIEQIAK